MPDLDKSLSKKKGFRANSGETVGIILQSDLISCDSVVNRSGPITLDCDTNKVGSIHTV